MFSQPRPDWDGAFCFQEGNLNPLYVQFGFATAQALWLNVRAMDLRTPEQTIAILATLGLAIAGGVQLFRWFFSGPKTPDPWGQTIADAVHEPESLPVCHRCLTPHAVLTHFCPHCGAAVGEFNNLLPFEQVFSEGEVLRNGTTLRTPPTFLRLVGYLLMSTAAFFVLSPLCVLAPIYWFLLARNIARRTEPLSLPDNEPPPLPPT